MAITIDKNNHDEEINQADKPVVLELFAEWCGICKQMKPIFQELEQELQDDYIFAVMDIDGSQDLATQTYGVRQVPTFIFLKNGKVKGKEHGYMSKEILKEKIISYLK